MIDFEGVPYTKGVVTNLVRKKNTQNREGMTRPHPVYCSGKRIPKMSAFENTNIITI